jgi:hypothetical protein
MELGMSLVIQIANNISFLPAGYQQAITTAVNYLESVITTDITVTFNFRWRSLPAGDLAQNSTQYDGYTYSQVYNAIQAVDGSSSASPVQQAAAASLAANFPTDPTNGGQFMITTADARALGLTTTAPAQDSVITLNRNDTFDWNPSDGIAAGQYDAVAALEHEMTEALGRTAFQGVLEPNLFDASGPALPTYNILDMFNYAAAGNAPDAAPGAATGALNEPFVAGYDGTAQGYFSYNGETVTLPFGSPSEIAAGDDVGDWNSSVVGDAFGFANAGVVGAISTTDLQTLSVLGYSLADVSCFCAGAMVATPGGEAAVETLKSGDLVTTLDGRAVPISWIGRRTVQKRFSDPLRVAPVRVRAGALGENLPARDLLLSADHALFVGGILIQAGALINGASILRETELPESFVYYHVETEDHALILVESAPAETFVDNVSRKSFDNWLDHPALVANGRIVPELPLPRVKSRRQVPASIRAALARRAQAIGAPATAAA